MKLLESPTRSSQFYFRAVGYTLACKFTWPTVLICSSSVGLHRRSHLESLLVYGSPRGDSCASCKNASGRG
jgi:hypothetical protein